MRLYHGSNIGIEKIDIKKSKPFKDFGKGFYLSDIESQASEMAVFKSNLIGGEPTVTRFEFDRNGLFSSALAIKIFNDYSDEWLDFVIANRTGKIDLIYDFVYGPIADDNVGAQLRKYNDKFITKAELLERLKYMKGITFQYFFGSESSLKFLKRI